MLEKKNLQPGPGDAVIFSSRAIPGNDRAIGAVIDQLYKSGAEVYDGRRQRVHVSGHACREELREMLELTRPELLSSRCTASIGISCTTRGLPKPRAWRDATATASPTATCSSFATASRGAAGTVPVGRVMIDGEVAGGVAETVVRDRRHISEDGVAMVIIAVSRQTGEIVSGPDFVTRGLASPGRRGRLPGAEEARHRHGSVRCRGRRWPICRSSKRRFGSWSAAIFAALSGRRPVVVPYVMEL